jgi:hypothetical protein
MSSQNVFMVLKVKKILGGKHEEVSFHRACTGAGILSGCLCDAQRIRG